MISSEKQIKKNATIAASLAATRAKRKNQICRVFTLKIQDSKLSKQQHEALKMVFVEAKWLRNEIIASDDVFKNKPGKTVKVKLREEFEERPFLFLGSQIKQSVLEQVKNDVRALAARKRNGGKIGRLKFVSDVKSVDLKQSGVTYKIHGSKLSVQKLPGLFRILGVSQLEGWELANAKLLNKPDGYYLAVACFKNSLAVEKDFQPGTVVGLDMGVKTHITLSDGREINAKIDETERLKRLQRKLNRQIKGSNNHWRTRNLIQREYQRISNRKNDLANKAVNEILKSEFVFMQDENLVAWRKKDGYVRGGRAIQHSILGRVKAKLSSHDRVVILSRNAATTQTCVCGVKTKHHPSQREFVCSDCGYSAPRDTHAAENMIRLGWDLVPVERGDFKPVESVSDWRSSDFQQYSAKPEATRLAPRRSSPKTETAIT